MKNRGLIIALCVWAVSPLAQGETTSHVRLPPDQDRSLIHVSASTQPADWRTTVTHTRLNDDLDRPQDGRCLDVIGSRRHIRFDTRPIVHNIKPGLFADEAVELADDGGDPPTARYPPNL